MSLINEKTCARCNKKLGLRKSVPREDWQYQGKLCKECYDYVLANSPIFEAEYKEGYSEWNERKKGILTIHNFDNVRRILFFSKANEKLEIPVETIQTHEMIEG